MTPTPREVDVVYGVLTRTHPRAAPFAVIAKAAHPLARRTARAALAVLCEVGLARSTRRGYFAATTSRVVSRR